MSKIKITVEATLSHDIGLALGKLSDKTKIVTDEFKNDVKSVRERDPAAKSDLEAALFYPGMHAIWAHRISHELYKKQYFSAARAISQTAKFFTGIEIHPGAKIGHGLFIDHGAAVVIGETAEIGNNCTIYQGVTLGGTGKETGKRHPTLGNDVIVGAGAKVLGGFEIGSGTKIAANAVVLSPLPENCTAVGIPARPVRMNGKRIDNLDQVHIPDPIEQELCAIKKRLNELESKTNQKTKGNTI